MTATRSRKEEITYKKHQTKKTDDTCAFCKIKKGNEQFINETKYFRVIRNIFSYSIWDGQKVVDHLMLIPKQHTDSLGDLPKAAAEEYVRIISAYEKKSYNIYARAPSSVIKSVIHQHTHFIKTKGGPKNFVFLLRKPYYLRFTV